jgi:hypothetical protein
VTSPVPLSGSLAAPRRFGSLGVQAPPHVPDFSAMDVGETVNGWIDFSQWLAAGETIASGGVAFCRPPHCWHTAARPNVATGARLNLS